VPVDPADVRKVVLEEKPGGLPLDDPQVQKARAKLFGAWEMNWMAYNYAHDVKLPGSSGPALAFLMYPQAETGGNRRDSLDPDQFRYTLNESHWRPWGHLLHSVRTGETAFDHVHGAGLFDYLAEHAEASALFNQGMAGNSPAHARLVARTYDFSSMTKVIDVGGGRGRLIATILAEHEHLRGILFDQPHVIESARETLDEAGVADRCELVGGSFFDAVPQGGDAYILRNIIHDWQDDQAIAILTACRRAMVDGARLILVERRLADDPREALPVLHADLEMLVNVGGRERTTEEYAGLLVRSGFRLNRTILLGRGEEAMGHYLVEAKPLELSNQTGSSGYQESPS
jgi:hypothetical protein